MKIVFNYLLIISLFIFYSCGREDKAITHLEQLHGGKTFAVPTGTVADQFVLKKFPDARIEYYNGVLDCAIAVKDGKADAAVYDLPVLKNIAAKNEGLLVLSELLFDDNYGFAFRLEDSLLKQAADEVLASLKMDGTYEEMLQRWLPEHGSPSPMPVLEPVEGGEPLRFGTSAVTEPITFYNADKQITGFDIEYGTYISRELGRPLEIVDMEFGALIPALVSGKVDMIGAGLSITEERAKKVLFSQPYYPSGIAAAVRAKPTPAPGKSEMILRDINDIHDKRIGVLLGSIHDAYVHKQYPKAEILTFQNVPDMLFALNSDKVDVAFFDHASLPGILSKNPGLGILSQDVFFAPIAAGFNSASDELREQFNAFLKEIRESGIYDQMIDRWVKQQNPVMPEFPASGSGQALRVGVVSDLGIPFSYIWQGKLIGFDIELGARFAAKLGRTYEPLDLQFGSLIASISTNKIDLITSSMAITEERDRQIDFSDPYYGSGVSVITQKIHLAASDSTLAAQPSGAGESDISSSTFFDKLANSFYNNIIHENRFQHILDGLRITLVISLLSALFGTIIGSLVCLMRLSRRKWVSNTARVYISIIRGIPVLVLLMIIYYVVFAAVNINPVIVSVIAFGLNFGAYVSEIFRSGIGSIDPGQRESAIATGFTKVQAFRYIIMPQALVPILPVYKGEFISLIKMTSIVGYIAVQDLTKASDIIRSRTFDAFFPLIMVAVLYFALAWLLTLALDYLEISVDQRRQGRKQGKEVQS